MADMGTLTMAMVADTMAEGIMEVVATIVRLTTDLQTDLIDQGLKTLLHDQIDQRPSHHNLLVNDLLPGHHEARALWEDHHEV